MALARLASARGFKWSKFILSWYGILLAYAVIVGLFLLLRLGEGNNPIALQLGSLTFRWYGLIITTGVIIASFLAQFLSARRGDDPDHVWRILPVLLVSGIVAARIWYVAFTWEGYKDYVFSIGNPVHAGAIEIWRGGIAIQGAVLGGILGTLAYGYIWNRRKNMTAPPFSIWRFADYVGPGLILAQGIGRWGNFMNNEAYGRETKMPWGIKIPCEYRTSGTTPGTVDTLCPQTRLADGGIKPDGIEKDALFHPTFFYESLWNYFTFLVLFYCIMKPKTIERRFKVRLRNGDVFLLYWVVYSIGRFFTESLRTDSLYIGGTGLRSAQVLAIIAILIAGFLLFYRHRLAFPTTEALSMRLAPASVAARPLTMMPDRETVTNKAGENETEDNLVAAGPVAKPDEAINKPDYKARVRPVAFTDTEPESDSEFDGELNMNEEKKGIYDVTPVAALDESPPALAGETATGEPENDTASVMAEDENLVQGDEVTLEPDNQSHAGPDEISETERKLI